MKTKQAKKISEALLVIRDEYRAEAALRPFSERKRERAWQYLDEMCGYIEKYSPDAERDMMFLCLGALDELMEENDAQKTAAFADAIHRIPFVFSGEETWDKTFKETHLEPFYHIYRDEWMEELINTKLPRVKQTRKGGKAGERTIYRFNEDETNFMSLPGYFCFRMLLPLIVIPFLLGCMLVVHFADYTEENHGDRYEITADSFEYPTDGDGDYLYIMDKDYEQTFQIVRFFELSDSPNGILALCESGETMVVYAEYSTPRTGDPYYRVLQVEDMNGLVYRSYQNQNEMDRYVLIFLAVCLAVILLPYLCLFLMMLIVAKNPRKFVSHPRFVKFCFPNYSLSLPKK